MKKENIENENTNLKKPCIFTKIIKFLLKIIDIVGLIKIVIDFFKERLKK